MTEQNIGPISLDLVANQDQYQAELRKATETLRATRAKMDADSRSIGGLFERIQTPVMGLRTLLVGGLVGGFALAVKGALDMAGALQDVKDSTGLSTDAIQEFRFAFGQVGVGASDTNAALQRFAANVGDARNGTGALVTSLKDTNRAFLDTIRGAGSMDEALDAAFRELANIADASQRAALAQDLFGKQGVKLAAVVANGAQGLEAMRQKARDLGLVLDSELIAAADDAGDQVAALAQTLDVQMKRTLIALTPVITATTAALSDMAVAFGKTWFESRQSLEQLSARLAGLNAQREALLAQGGFAKALTLGAVDKDIAAVQELIGKEVQFIAQKQNEAEARKGNVKAIKEEAGAQREYANLQASASTYLEEYNRLAGVAKNLRTNLRTEQEKQNDTIEEYNTLLDAGLISITEYNTALDRMAVGMRNVEESGKKGVDIAKEWGNVWTSALEDVIVDMIMAGDQAIDFQKILRALLADLIRIAARKAIAEAIAGASSTSTGPILPGGVGAQPYATGGPISAGQLAMVGERGRELFVPAVDGSIVPSHELSRMGGDSITVNFSGVSAKDIPMFEAMIDSKAPQIVAAAQQQSYLSRRRGGRG